MALVFKRLYFQTVDLHLKWSSEKKKRKKECYEIFFSIIISYRNNHSICYENDKIKINERKRLKNVLTTTN